MNKNKISYLITIIITLFSFNISASAAQELTCVYKYNGYNNIKPILIQEEDGTLKLYTHNKDASINAYGWHLNGGGKKPGYVYNPLYQTLPNNQFYNSLQRDYIRLFDQNSNLKNAQGELDECPKWYYVNEDLTSSSQELIFFDPNKTMSYAIDISASELEVQHTNIVIPDKITINEYPDKMGGKADIDTNIYPNSCNYKREVSPGEIHYIQLYYGTDKMIISEYDPEKQFERILYDPSTNGAVSWGDMNYSGYQYAMFWSVINNQQIDAMTTPQIYTFDIDDEFTIQYIEDYYEGSCPPILAVERIVGYRYDDSIQAINTTIKTHGFLTETNVFVEKYFLNQELPEFEVKFGKVNITSCEDLFGEEISGYISLAWGLVKIAVPIILIIFGTIDFAQAIFSGKEDNMKKAQAKFIKRIAIAIVIFIIPLILGLLLETANGIWDNIGKDICGLIF